MPINLQLLKLLVFFLFIYVRLIHCTCKTYETLQESKNVGKTPQGVVPAPEV